MFFKVLIFLCALVALAYGGNADKCEKIEPIENFDAKKTGGIWYAQQASVNVANYIGDCLKFDITGVKGLIKKSRRINGEYQYENLRVVQEGNTSKYYIKMGSKKSYPHYWVVTDYDNFVVYYRCFEGKGDVDIATRTRNPDAETMKKAKEAMKEKGFNPDKITVIKQNDCTN